MNTLFGLKIIEAPITYNPVIKLNPNVQVSAEFREHFDQWLIDMFGVREYCPVEKNMAYFLMGLQ